MKFPENFLWGAAASAYQVEGNNANADWWPWEKEKAKENSGQACRHYELYAQDFDLAKSLHHNAHRLSIEWARIEPQEGKFSEEEMRHYMNVIAALKERGIEPVVTLHHFTNPIWLSQMGGWQNRRSIELFDRYCDFVVGALAPQVKYWITINEPTVYIYQGCILGVWPPSVVSKSAACRVFDNFAGAHIAGYRRIHQIYKELKLGRPMVSFAHHMQPYVACVDTAINRWAAALRNKFFNFGFIDKVRGSLDYIGINYYSRQLVELRGWGFSNWTGDVCGNNHHPVKKNTLGWDIYPQGLYDLLVMLKKLDLPIIITENGICTLDDDLRWEFLYGHLKSIYLAIQKGVDVRGYLHWALLDNFEWDKGFGPRFGLVDVNYQTFQRTAKQSAIKYGEVCKSGVLPENP